jgi:hypothetical protein
MNKLSSTLQELFTDLFTLIGLVIISLFMSLGVFYLSGHTFLSVGISTAIFTVGFIGLLIQKLEQFNG